MLLCELPCVCASCSTPHTFYFDVASCIGEAANPGPIALCLDLLLPNPIGSGQECDEEGLAAACALWRMQMLHHRHACRAASDAPTGGEQILVAEVLEDAAFAAARLAIISYSQRVRRKRRSNEAVEAESDRAEEDISADTEDGPCTKDIKHAVRNVEEAVQAAFLNGRTPTSNDVVNITTQMQGLAVVVTVGRQENHVQGAQGSIAPAAKADSAADRCRTATRADGIATRQTSAGSLGTRVQRRRRGKGGKKFFDVYYGNVTSMSKKAEHYLLSLSDGMWFAAESHIRHEDMDRRASVWSGNWDITAAPAVPSTDSITGSYGGVVAAARKHLGTSVIAGDVLQSAWCKSAEIDLAGRTVHLRGVDVMVIGGYARHGDYSSLAAAVARITRNGKLPFIWLTDFNASPTELEEAEWLDQLDAKVIRPDASLTCHQGGGSLIDYGILSRCLIPYIEQFVAVAEVPWGPHDGLRLRINRNPRAVMVRSIVRPRALAEAQSIAGRGPPADLCWATAISLAQPEAKVEFKRESDTTKAQRRAANSMGIGDISEQLGLELAAWAHATELQALSRAGVAAGVAARPFLGRGSAPRFRMLPLMQRPRLVAEALRLPGGYGLAARLWATCRALAAKLRTAMIRNASPCELCLMRSRLVALAMRNSADLRCAWEVVTDGADVAAGLFAILIACSRRATTSSLDTAIKTFERLEHAEMERGREFSRAAWDKWVGESIAGGAKQAHRWTNRPNAVVGDVTAPEAKGPLDVARHHTSVWAGHWKAADARKVHEAFSAVESLRSRALTHPTHCAGIDRIVPRKLREAARKFRKGTSIGSDAIAFQDIVEASEESLEELCRIMRDAVRKLAMPMTSFLVLVSLLGKKLGGTRCIAICTTFYRLLIAVMKEDVRMGHRCWHGW